MAFASSRKAIAECDICGFRFKLRELRNIITRGRDTNIKACPKCFSPDHPQNKQGLYPVRDPQAIRAPRPDFAGYIQSRNYAWGWNPVGDGQNNYGLSKSSSLKMISGVGSVTVTT